MGFQGRKICAVWHYIVDPVALPESGTHFFERNAHRYRGGNSVLERLDRRLDRVFDLGGVGITGDRAVEGRVNHERRDIATLEQLKRGAKSRRPAFALARD